MLQHASNNLKAPRFHLDYETKGRTSRPNCVLVALDGDSIAEQAIPLAAGLSKQWNAPLHLVHVQNPIKHAPGNELLHFDWVSVETRFVEYLHNIARELRGSYGLPVRSEVVIGVSVANTLRSISETGSCALVMVRPRRSSLSRFWWGSVTDDLIGRLTVPLLILPEAVSEGSPVETIFDGGFKKMLVYLDGNDASAPVVENAIALASEEAECQLLRVLPSISRYTKWRGGTARPSDLRAEAWRDLYRAREELEQKGIACKSQLIVDGQTAGSAIVDQARASRAQLIVLAARQHLLPWWLREGVAEHVVRHANIPVLIVPSDGNLTPQGKTNHVDFRSN